MVGRPWPAPNCIAFPWNRVRYADALSPKWARNRRAITTGCPRSSWAGPALDRVRVAAGPGQFATQQVGREAAVVQVPVTYSPLGGWAATNDASLSILPTFAAPPGEPRSSKNS